MAILRKLLFLSEKRFAILFTTSGVVASLAFLRSHIFLNGDAVTYFYPYAVAWHKGPVAWNGNILFGFPPASSFQFGFFNPIYRAAYSLIEDPYVAYNLLVLGMVILSGILTYLLCRKLSLGVAAAFIGASAYALGGFNAHWFSNVAVIASAPLLPAGMLAVWGIFHHQFKWVTLFSVLLGLSLLGAHQQFVLMNIACVGLYFLAVSIQKSKIYGWKHIRFPAIVFTGSIAIGLVIGLPQIITTFFFTPFSTRSVGLTYAQAAVGGATPLDFLKVLFPFLYSRFGISTEFLPYVGFLPLVFAILSIFHRTRKHVLFFIALAFGGLLTSVIYSPLFWVLTKLPVFEYFRGPSRFSGILVFSLAILAAFGAAWWFEQRPVPGKWADRIMVVFIVLISLVNVFADKIFQFVITIAQRFFDQFLYGATTGLPLDYYHLIIEQAALRSLQSFLLSNPEFLVSFAAIISGYLVFRFNQRLVGGLRYITMGLVSINLFLVAYYSNSFVPVGFLKQASPLTDALNTSQPMRVHSVLTGFGSSHLITATRQNAQKEGVEFIRDSLTTNINIISNIDHVAGYEPMAWSRTQEVLGYIGGENVQFYPSLSDESISIEEKMNKLVGRLDVLSQLNVKYLISPYAFPHHGNLRLIKAVTSTKFLASLYLYENIAVLPRLYVAEEVTSVDGGLEAFSTFVRQKPGAIVLECQGCSRETYSQKAIVQEREFKAGSVSALMQSQGGNWLVLAESFLPGWHASIDSVEVPIQRANYIFQAIYVPSGTHQIRFWYDASLLGILGV